MVGGIRRNGARSTPSYARLAARGSRLAEGGLPAPGSGCILGAMPTPIGTRRTRGAPVRADALRALVVPIVSLAMTVAMSIPVEAQRAVERHDFDSPEGRLLAYYSAALAFTSGGPALGGRPWSIDLGLEATYVPGLSREQRQAGSDKPQSSNLAPAYPRPRVAITFPGRVQAEASWIPPVRVFDAEANLLSIGVSRPIRDVAGVTLVPRLALTTGRIEGAITCNDELLDGSRDQQVYFGAVCQGRESEDHFEPRHYTAEVLGSRPIREGRLVPYASIGIRHERTRFDIGVIRPDGSRETDHPILTMRTTRPFAVGGMQWRPHTRFATGGELYYAPGSLLTARLLATLHLRAP